MALLPFFDTRIQWSAFGQAAEVVQHFFPYICPASRHFLWCRYMSDFQPTLFKPRDRRPVQILVQHVSDVGVVRQIDKEVEVVRFLSAERVDKQAEPEG